MKLVITIIEDTVAEQEYLSTILDDWSKKNSFEIEKRIFTSGEDYLRSTDLLSESSDLFILDIQLKNKTGLEIAELLRKANYSGHIIFLTAFREYVFHGYKVHALNYLLKPVDKSTLFLCLDEIADTLIGRTYLYHNKQVSINIPYKNIMCFSSSLHNINILTTEGLYTQYASLNSIVPFLPHEFIRVHKSHVVNLSHIYKISGSVITLSNQMTVEIGPSYIKQVYSDFASYSSRFDIL